ncbi:MAG: hypothetical protein ABI651_03530 [Verrucomicrobiota bacterium]
MGVDCKVSKCLPLSRTKARASDKVLREIPVGSFDPTPTFIREGRGFLYDSSSTVCAGHSGGIKPGP